LVKLEAVDIDSLGTASKSYLAEMRRKCIVIRKEKSGLQLSEYLS